MASKIANHLGKILLVWSGTTQTEDPREIETVIDVAIQGKTISAKEVARLQESERILSSAIEANNDLLRTNSELKRELAITDHEASILAKWLVAEKHKVEALRTKLWDAEQEIRDLKRDSEKLMELASYKAKIQDATIDLLERKFLDVGWEYLKLWSGQQVVHIANEITPTLYSDPEQISPPPCLKPLDAMKWNEQMVIGSITY